MAFLAFIGVTMAADALPLTPDLKQELRLCVALTNVNRAQFMAEDLIRRGPDEKAQQDLELLAERIQLTATRHLVKESQSFKGDLAKAVQGYAQALVGDAPLAKGDEQVILHNRVGQAMERIERVTRQLGLPNPFSQEEMVRSLTGSSQEQVAARNWLYNCARSKALIYSAALWLPMRRGSQDPTKVQRQALEKFISRLQNLKQQSVLLGKSPNLRQVSNDGARFFDEAIANNKYFQALKGSSEISTVKLDQMLRTEIETLCRLSIDAAQAGLLLPGDLKHPNR